MKEENGWINHWFRLANAEVEDSDDDEVKCMYEEGCWCLS